jgi:hypothetical protein
MTKRERAIKSLDKKMQNRIKQFDNWMSRTDKEIIDFVDKYGIVSEYTLQGSLHNAEKLTDSLCLSGVWITDRLTGFCGAPSDSPVYRKSLTKKVRKALGYNI